MSSKRKKIERIVRKHTKKGGHHIGFSKLENELAHRKGVTNPGALAAYIGRRKYGRDFNKLRG